MRRLSIIVLAALCASLLLGALPASAQDIVGISMRPAEAAPADAQKGTADIVQSGEGFLVSLDLGGNKDVFSLDDYPDATAFVVWAIDMDGQRHNIGTLDDELVIEDVEVDFVVARLYVTAESDPDATNPSMEPTFRATLRNVKEVEAEGATKGTTTSAASTGSTTAKEKAAAPTPTPAPKSEPQQLPTTGSPLQDMAVLAAVALVLLAAGLKLATVRLGS